MLRASRGLVSDAGVVAELLPFLCAHAAVTALDLRASGLSDVGLTPLLLHMARPSLSSSVHSLDLSGLSGFTSNALGPAAAAALRTCLSSSHSSLTTLLLSSLGRLSLRSAVLGSSAFSCAPRLLYLDVSGNSLGPSLVRLLLAQLSAPHCRLQRLHLDGNCMGDGCSAALHQLLLSSTSLTSLHLAHNQLTQRTLTAIAQALAPDTATLKTLTLDHNPHLCSAASNDAPLPAAAVNPQAQLLQGSSQLPPSFAASSRAAAPSFPRPASSPPSPLSRLSDALLVNVSLRSLSLSDCGVVCVEEMAVALSGNCTLTRLSLSSNPLSSAACSLLLSSLHRNSGLLSLSLCDLQLDDSVAPALCALLLRNPFLTRLSLTDNRLTDATLTQLLQLVQHHPHCNLPFPGRALSRNHLTQRSLARLRLHQQRNARVQRALLLRRYRSTIEGLHALPSQVAQCRADIQQLLSDCDAERAKEEQTQARLARQSEELQAELRAAAASLQRVREERVAVQGRQSEQLAALSLQLSDARGLLKASASNLRVEVVAEKKAQAAVLKQLSRQQALTDSLDEVRRSGDAVLASLHQQTAAARLDLAQLQEQAELWANRLTQLATRVVHRYYLALHAFAHASSRRTMDARVPHSRAANPHASATPQLQLQPLSPRRALGAKAESSPRSASSSSSSPTPSLERFVPPLPPLGCVWDVNLSEFVAWMFHTATPSATVAVMESALLKRMPVIAFAQATVALAAQNRGGGELAISLTCSVEPHHQQPTAVAPLSPPSPSSALPRAEPAVVGVEMVELSSTAAASAALQSAPSPLFTGCTLLVQAASPALTLPPPSPLFPSAASPPLPSLSSSSSCVLLDADLSMSWAALLRSLASIHRLEPAQLLPSTPPSSASAVRLCYLPGLRLRLPWSSYVVDTPETPRLSLEEALAELGGGKARAAGGGGGALSSSASQLSASASASSLSSAFPSLASPLPSLTEELSSLLAAIKHGGEQGDAKPSGDAAGGQHPANNPQSRAAQAGSGLHSPVRPSATSHASAAARSRSEPAKVRGKARAGGGRRSLRRPPPPPPPDGSGDARADSSGLLLTVVDTSAAPRSLSHSFAPPIARPSSSSSSLQRPPSLSGVRRSSLVGAAASGSAAKALEEKEKEELEEKGYAEAAAPLARRPSHSSRARVASTIFVLPPSEQRRRNRRASSIALDDGGRGEGEDKKKQPHPLLQRRSSLATSGRGGEWKAGREEGSGVEEALGGRLRLASLSGSGHAQLSADEVASVEGAKKEGEEAEEQAAEDDEADDDGVTQLLAPADAFLLRIRSLSRPPPAPSNAPDGLPPLGDGHLDVVDAAWLQSSGGAPARASSSWTEAAPPPLLRPASSLSEATQLLLRPSSSRPLLRGASDFSLALHPLHRLDLALHPADDRPALVDAAAVADDAEEAGPECLSLALQPPPHLQLAGAGSARSQLFATVSAQSQAVQADFRDDVAFMRSRTTHTQTAQRYTESSSRSSTAGRHTAEEVEGEGQQALSAVWAAACTRLAPSALSAIRPWPQLCHAQHLHSESLHPAHAAQALSPALA